MHKLTHFKEREIIEILLFFLWQYDTRLTGKKKMKTSFCVTKIIPLLYIICTFCPYNFTAFLGEEWLIFFGCTLLEEALL